MWRRAHRPIWWPSTASRRRWSSVSRMRWPSNCAFRARFSSRRKSMTVRCSRSTHPRNATSRRWKGSTRQNLSETRYTSPMPPAPIRATISYGPRRVPAVSNTMIDSDYTGEAGFGEANQRAMPHANRLQLSAAANLWEPPTIFLSGFPHAWAAIVSTVRRVRNGEKVRRWETLPLCSPLQVIRSGYLHFWGAEDIDCSHPVTVSPSNTQPCSRRRPHCPHSIWKPMPAVARKPVSQNSPQNWMRFTERSRTWDVTRRVRLQRRLVLVGDADDGSQCQRHRRRQCQSGWRRIGLRGEEARRAADPNTVMSVSCSHEVTRWRETESLQKLPEVYTEHRNDCGLGWCRVRNTTWLLGMSRRFNDWRLSWAGRSRSWS